MTDKTKKAELNEAELDQVQGGLLLPAVQKVREAARRTSAEATHSGGANVLMGDGSVKF